MTSPDAMPAWPECDAMENNVWTLREYERARAAAWEARCRAAVEALQQISSNEKMARESVAAGYHNTTFAIDLAGRATMALAAIGPLPPLSPPKAGEPTST